MSEPISSTAISPRSRAMVGIWIFVLSDAVGFAALLTTVMALRTSSDAFANSDLLQLSDGSIATTLLVGISVSLVLARKYSSTRRALLAIATLLACGFCVLQYFEYRAIFEVRNDGHAIAPGLESFVVVSAYHLLHILAGVVALLWALPQKDIPLGPLSVYWHFVDGLWLFIFTLFYLL